MQLFRGSGKGSDEDFVAQTKQLFKPKSCNNCARLRRINKKVGKYMGYCYKQNEDAKARLVKQRLESVGLAFSL